MKRLFCVLLSVCMLFSLAGCNGCGTGNGGEPQFDFSIESIMSKYDASLYTYDGPATTLTMSHFDSAGAAIERAVVNEVLKGFKMRYPTIDVKLDIISDYENTYSANIATDTMHDVFLVPDGVMASWSVGNKMLNLDPYIAASELIDTDEIYASALDRYRYNAATGLTGSGNILALPKDIGPQVMYYNKDIFDEMGVDYPPNDRIMTLDEAVEMWQALTKKSSSGAIQRYGVAGLSPEGLVWSAGGDFLNAERTAFPTEKKDVDAIKRAYQFLQDAYLNYKITPPAEFSVGMNTTTLFSMQRVACLLSGRWEVTSFRELSFNWDIAYIPAFEVAPEKNFWSGSVAYAVNRSCASREAAWKLVEYIASKEGQEILSATGFQIPVYKELGLSEDLVAREKALGPYNYEIFIEAAETQPSGLWQYRASQKWKEMGYDLKSEKLFDSDNPMTIDEFIEQARAAVNSNL